MSPSVMQVPGTKAKIYYGMSEKDAIRVSEQMGLDTVKTGRSGYWYIKDPKTGDKCHVSVGSRKDASRIMVKFLMRAAGMRTDPAAPDKPALHPAPYPAPAQPQPQPITPKEDRDMPQTTDDLDPDILALNEVRLARRRLKRLEDEEAGRIEDVTQANKMLVDSKAELDKVRQKIEEAKQGVLAAKARLETILDQDE